MKEGRGFRGLIHRASYRPTALDRLQTMRSLAGHLDDFANPGDWKSNSRIQLSRLAQGIVTSPRREVRRVERTLHELLTSGNVKDKQAGAVLRDEITKARKDLLETGV